MDPLAKGAFSEAESVTEMDTPGATDLMVELVADTTSAAESDRLMPS